MIVGPGEYVVKITVTCRARFYKHVLRFDNYGLRVKNRMRYLLVLSGP